MQISIGQIKIAVKATAEVCGSQLSDEAIEIMVSDLRGNDPQSVLNALSRCRRELKGRFSLSEILARIDTGWPSPEVAWAAMNVGEDATIIMCEEMGEASAAARPLLEINDKYGARQAFESVYLSAIDRARSSGRKYKPWVSLGHNVDGRKVAIKQAASTGLLTDEMARHYLPNLDEKPDDRGIYGVLEDMTKDEKIPEDQRAMAKAKLKEMMDYLDRISSNDR